MQQVAAVVSAVGGVFLLVYLFTEKVFGLHLVGFDRQTSLVWLWENRDVVSLKPGEALARAQSFFWVGNLSLSQVLVQYFGRSLFMTAVFADALVRRSLSVWEQEHHFAATPAATTLTTVMSNLETGGSVPG